jgi:hypothetical protein
MTLNDPTMLYPSPRISHHIEPEAESTSRDRGVCFIAGINILDLLALDFCSFLFIFVS